MAALTAISDLVSQIVRIIAVAVLVALNVTINLKDLKEKEVTSPNEGAYASVCYVLTRY